MRSKVRRVAAISPSATLAVDAKAKALIAQGRPVITYAAGEPDFPTPDHIVEAAIQAAKDPKNHRYTQAVGLPELREAIVAKTLLIYGGSRARSLEDSRMACHRTGI
jgi:aspartate aminotransferase